MAKVNTPFQDSKFVKVVGSDFLLIYPQKQVMHKGKKSWHYDDDKSQPPVRQSRNSIILVDNEDGTHTSWGYSVWGPIGQIGKLHPDVQVTDKLNGNDMKQVARLIAQHERAMNSQASLFVAMGGNPKAVRDRLRE